MTWAAFMFRRMSSPGLLLIWVDTPWAFVASSWDTTRGQVRECVGMEIGVVVIVVLVVRQAKTTMHSTVHKALEDT